MRAVDFVLETVSHFARGVEGPPPGVPFHADAEFETDLVALCQHHQLSSFVSDSFDKLALPPAISRITIARIKHYAGLTEQLRRRRLSAARRVMVAMETAGVRVAVLGDVDMACRDDRTGELRPVDVIDLMIDENQWMEAVGVLRESGFVRTRVQPHLAGSPPPRGESEENQSPPAATTDKAAADALRYHQYFAPLLMHNHAGDLVQLRFRVIDIAHPHRTNVAWDRIGTIDVDGEAVPALCPEDELIQTVISLGAEGFVDLLRTLDAGRLLSRLSPPIDWDYITWRLKAKGMYPAFYFTLEHICATLHIPRATESLERPSAWRRWVFHRWWKPGDADYSGETEPWGGRFSFGLIECGGPLSKLLWLRRALFPKSAWVRSVYGRPANLWLRLKFLHDVRSGRWRRSANPARSVAEISGLHRSHE